MALPVGFKAIVTRLDAGTLTSLLARLLQAETDRLRMPAGSVVVSEALTDADDGLDARIDETPDESQHIPSGLSGFQFKAYKTKAVSALKLDEELARPGPTRVIENGGTYVLVWQADLNYRQRTAAEAALDTQARKIIKDPRWRIWDASAIVALAERHPAVVEALALVEFEAVRGLDELQAALRIEDRPYEADGARAAAIEQIRDRAREQTTDALVATLSGLAGTGKTRLAVEALDVDGLRDSVVYAGSAQGLQTFVARIVNDERTSGILVVDELDDSDQRDIYNRFAATRGKWRLLPIVAQTTSRYRPTGPRDVVLAPLEADATRRLVEATSGLSEAQARIVADVAQGFPELAFRLAEELIADPTLDLLTLAHLVGLR
jgi:hypothetical protein